jgi:hypothetical protein
VSLENIVFFMHTHGRTAQPDLLRRTLPYIHYPIIYRIFALNCTIVFRHCTPLFFVVVVLEKPLIKLASILADR